MANLFVATGASAIEFIVNSASDGADDNVADGVCHTLTGTCTLRAAAMQANHIVNEDSTIVVPSGFYQLGPATDTDGENSGDLNLIAPVSGNPVITITGAGNISTFIVGNGTDRVLTVAAGRTAVIGSVTLAGGNFVASGGGILNNGVLTLTNAVLTYNGTQGCGGGVYNTNQLGIYSSTVADNGSGSGGGGGICNEAGAGLTIVRSTIDGNYAIHGGGIENLGVSAVINSTMTRNHASATGGGINNLGVINIYNSTIVDNLANTSDGVFTGGGIYNDSGDTANLRNTVVARNTAGAFGYNDCTGTLGSYGRNRFWVVAGCTINQFGAGNAGLLVSLAEMGQLRDNGGPTKTIALVPPGDMIDGADSCIDQNSATLSTDQRGKARTVGAHCDIGAFEYDPDVVFFDGFQ